MTTTSTPQATTTSPRARRGAALLIAGPLQFLGAHLITQSGWNNPEYSWWSNYISDLGATTCGEILGNVVCSPLHPVMNASFVLQGILLTLGVALIWPGWARTRSTSVWKAMMLVTGASWVVVGLIPEDVNLAAHSVGALPVFVVSNAALLVAGSSRSTHPRVRRAALTLGVLGVIGFALIFLTLVWPDTPIQIGAAERIAVFPHQAWVLVAGISLLLDLRQDDHPELAAEVL